MKSDRKDCLAWWPSSSRRQRRSPGYFFLLGSPFEPLRSGVAFLLLAFSSAVVVNLVRGRRITCGCFGTVSQREISALAVVRNLIFVGLAVTVAWRAPAVLAIDDRLQDTSSGLSTVDGVALMIVGSLGAFTLAIAQEALNVWRSQASFERTRAKAT